MKGKIRNLLKCRSFFAFLVLCMTAVGYGIYKYGTRAEAADEHIHDMSAECGQESAVTFTEWTETDSLPDTAGSYFLSADVTLSETWTISSGTINLCLNGYEIKLTAPTSDLQKNSIVKLTGNATLNLCDCSAEGSGKINGEKKEGIPRHTGIYVNGAVLNMYGGQITGNTGCRVTGPNNSALVCGGGLYAESGEVHLYGGSITENTAENCGGGIYAVSNSKIYMHSDEAVIFNNQSAKTYNGSSYGDGGGIYLEGSLLCLEQGVISGNSAGNYGGGLHAINNSEIQIKGGTISKNKAQGGGGIFAREGNTLLFSGGNIQENEAGSGGGLFLFNNSIEMSGGKISQNKALGSIGAKGGGILFMSGGTFRMSGGEICGNSSALSAGGVYIDDFSSSFIMTGGIISGNKAENSGGGVLISAGTAELSGEAKIKENEAKGYGGGVSIFEDGSFAMKGGEISGNIGGTNGGGVYVTGTFVLYDSSVIKDNKDKYTNSTNVFLWPGCKITIGETLGDTILNNPVGVSIYNSGTGIFTEGWTDKMSDQNVEEFFVAEQPDYQVSLKDEEGFIGFLGYSLTYVIPENEGISGTVPETARYPKNTRIDMDESKNTLTKKGYTHIGWKWQERELTPVTYVLMSMSKELYPVFSRNFTVEDTRIESKAGEAVTPLDLNKLVSFDEGVTETEKNFRFEISGTEQLPEGLHLENGILSGTPEKDGEFTVTIAVQDLAVNGQSRTLTLTFIIEKPEKQAGTASVTQKDLYCGERPEPVPVSETNGTAHVTYFYKPASAPDEEYTQEAPTTAGEYTVRAVFAETDTYKEVIAEAGFMISHKCGETWETDETSHWHVCVCGAKEGMAAHSEDGGTVTQAPSADRPGEKTYKCSVCRRILRTEEIPPVIIGKIEKEIEKGDNVPDINVPVSLKELADIVLTREEQESVGTGIDIKIILKVTDAEKLVGNEEKEIVQAALNNFEKGQYLDISLFKLIGETESKIEKISDKIRLVIEIPEHLKRKDNPDKRMFAIIRVHDGKADWLTDLDDDRDTVTIETDCFSTYVLVYRDDKTDIENPDDDKKDDDTTNTDKNNKNDTPGQGEESSSPRPDGGDAGRMNETPAAAPKSGTANNNSVKTGDSAKTGFWLAVLILSGAACPLLYSGIRRKRGKEV